MSVKTLSQRAVLFLAVLAILAVPFALNAKPAAAAGDDTVFVSVYHAIPGQLIGLSKELPVDVLIYKDGFLFAKVTGFEFRERFEANLPAGNYRIEIMSQELGVVIPSMTIGPVDLPGGVEVRIQAQLGAGLTPITSVRVK